MTTKCPKCGQWYLVGLVHLCPNEDVPDNKLAMETMETMAALHYDTNKTPMDLLPWDLLQDLCGVYGFGAFKYKPNNWRVGTFRHGAIFASAMRHLTKHYKGELLDLCENDRENCNTKGPDGTCNSHSGLPHLLHAAWNCLTLWDMTKNGTGQNDLWFWKEKEERKE